MCDFVSGGGKMAYSGVEVKTEPVEIDNEQR